MKAPKTLVAGDGTQIILGAKQSEALDKFLKAKADLKKAQACVAAAELDIEPVVRLAYASIFASSGEKPPSPVKVIGENNQATYAVSDYGASVVIKPKAADKLEEDYPLVSREMVRFEALKLDSFAIDALGLHSKVATALRSIKCSREEKEQIIRREDVVRFSAPLIPSALEICGKSPERLSQFLADASPAITVSLK